MYNVLFKKGMLLKFKDENLGKNIIVVVDEIYPWVIKGRVCKKKNGKCIVTNIVRTLNKKDFFCGWGQSAPIGKIL